MDSNNELIMENKEMAELPEATSPTPKTEQRIRKAYATIAICAVVAFCIPLLGFILPKAKIKERMRQADSVYYQKSAEESFLSQMVSDTTAAISSMQQARNSITEQEYYIVETAERKKARRIFTVNDYEFTMIKVQGGTFKMGSSNGGDDESPVHCVTLSSYYIGETEVTRGLWEAVMHDDSDNDYPKTHVSWEECLRFVRTLNHETGLMFSLPTEAQWEFAARGGNKSKGYKYSGSNNCSSVANHVEYSFWGDLLGYSNSVDFVGSYSPNELGIYDMSGNVWEWCFDDYRSYTSNDVVDPIRNTMNKKVIRGGGFKSTPSYCRSTYRGSRDKDDSSAENIGFRLVLNE